MKRRIAALLLASTLSAALQADPLPTAPQLRIETGRHTAFIHALVLDESAGRLYSASEDKTIRVWRIADGRLLDIFRIPAGTRGEGQLYALALSPDRRVLATAGWTCWDSDGRACIYLLDASTGAILGEIGGLSEVVATLQYSRDGKHLAAGLMGAEGLRVFRVSDHVQIAEDHAYRDKLLELDFGLQGQLAAAGIDGFVRLYDAQLKLVGRVDANLAGHEPFGIRYSPDGRYVAVGFNDVVKISVLRASDLGLVATLAPTAGPAPRNLTRVAWAPDSASVYGTGEPGAAPGTGIFRWRLSDPTHAEYFPAAQGRIGDIAVTHDNSLLFGAEDPVLGMLDPTGRVRYLLGSGVPDYAESAATLRVSRDGSDVEVAIAGSAGALRRFSVTRGILERVDSPTAALVAPVVKASGWTITHWRDDAGPLINGRRPALDPYETPHAIALAPKKALAVLGTEWSLRALARDNAIKWSVRTTTVVRAVNVSGDERFVLAALADGTINWYRLDDGTLALSLFLHADGETWVAWTPDGTYASSAYGDNLVGWQINRGRTQAPDFFRAVQFERELYRPDVIAASLRANADQAIVRSAAPTVNRLLAIAPPRLALVAEDANPRSAAGSRTIRVRGESLGLPMSDVALYVNDIPITPSRERRLSGSESQRFEREFTVTLTTADNDLRVEVFNGQSLGVAERYIAGPQHPADVREAGDLYVLAVGVNQFPNLSSSLYLSYAARDAEEFSKAMNAVAAQRFRKVHSQVLSDVGQAPLKASVLSALNTLSKANGADTVIVFLASHGVSDAAGNYFFVPRDVEQVDVDAILDKKPLRANSSMIGWLSLFEGLRNTAGRRLLIVDTCHARDVTGQFQDFALVKRSASSHLAFILAAKGDEESQENARAQHGLFTYGLLEGLSGQSDSNHDGQVSVAEWFHFAAQLVEQRRDRRVGPQTPQFYAPLALQVMPISQVPRPR